MNTQTAETRLAPAANDAADILVVEDSRVQLKLLQSLLEKRGYGVRVAFDGLQAMEMARDKTPDLVISDILMPAMNGYEMCAALRRDAELCDTPVILLTSLTDASDIVEGLKAQADYYLTKPYSADYLLAAIHDILQNPLNAPDETLPPMEVTVGETRHEISAGRRQILGLLLSAYGNAVEQNRVLTQTQHELRSLNDQLRAYSQQITAQRKELEEANVQLQSLATTDGLTKLKNHRAFKEKIEEEWQRAARYGQPLSLLLLDVDSFKNYNDTFGHPAGDDVLIGMARLLRENSRASDFVARYGGEEFAVLLPNTDKQWALFMAERLRSAIASEGWPLCAVTASFGAATFDDALHRDATSSALIQNADRALYHSKRNGRNRSTHSDEAADLQ